MKGLEQERKRIQCEVNRLYDGCDDVIQLKKKISNNFCNLSKRYKCDLNRYKSNLKKQPERPSFDQKRELLKIRERKEFKNEMVNFLLSSLVDKRRAAYACQEKLKNEKEMMNVSMRNIARVDD